MNNVGTIISNLVTKQNWQLPTFLFPKKTLLEKIRSQQWSYYQKPYKKFVSTLSSSSKATRGKISIIDLSLIGSKLGITNIKEEISIPSQTKLALMCCVDEGTQTGEFVQEENMNGEQLGTVADPSIPRYLIDVPGSGVLLYEVEEAKGLTKEKLFELESKRVDELSNCIANWCKKNGIIKFTVTYHAGCGAVHKRFAHNPEICSGNELEFARKVAIKTAKSISKKAQEKGYNLDVTVAFIGNKQMNKIRPSELHNALGTAACLDSRISVYKLDSITGTNFFDVSVFNDLLEDTDNHELNKDFLANAIHDIELTINIAIGTSGWNNEYFDGQNPYPVMLFAGNDVQENDAEKIFNVLGRLFPDHTTDKLGFYIIRTDL